MKYILMVHHDEEVLSALGENKLQQMRAESVRLANQIHTNGKYVDAAPLHPAATGASAPQPGKRHRSAQKSSRIRSKFPTWVG